MYKELTGICKIAISKGLCLGCVRLEQEEFTGVKKCKNIESLEYKQIEVKE